MQHKNAAATGITASADLELIARGRYLVNGPIHCGACHALDDGKSAPPELYEDAFLAGGKVWDLPSGMSY
ncbi:MAG: hypothetical protein GY822_28035 [Deltaproteobacteria bacterium]|nr:hypothetical protein [Deltaproteobacteria bacterium]